jgi:hypothetical protein
MTRIRRHVLLGLLVLIGAPCWPASGWAAGPATFSANVPAGQSNSVRLNQLPRDAVVSIQVQTDGLVLIALLSQQDFKNPAGPARPLFQGEATRSITFSVTIPVEGDYYLRLDNRRGITSRSVSVTVTGEAGQTDMRRATLERLKASERTLKAFEARLNLALIFESVPIKIRACPSATSFLRADTLILCAAYVQRLHALAHPQFCVDEYM